MFQNAFTICAVLGRNHQDVIATEIQSLFYLFDDHVDFGRFQVDFIDDRYDLQARLEGQIEIGYCLSLVENPTKKKNICKNFLSLSDLI